MSGEKETKKYRRYGLILYYLLKLVGKTLIIILGEIMSGEKETKKYRRYGLILYYLLKLVGKTLKVKLIRNDKVKENEESYIFAFWHNKLVIPSLCLDYIDKRAVLASPSKDGELISVPLEKMGFHMVRGSSDKNSTSSLISLIRLMKQGYSIGTPVDGPKGPIYEVKPGMIYLAQKGRKYIIFNKIDEARVQYRNSSRWT